MLRDLEVIRGPPRKRARDAARVAEDRRIRSGVALARQLPRAIVLGLKISRPFRLQCSALLTLAFVQPVGTSGGETTFVGLLATLGVQAVASWQIGSAVPLSGAPILDCSGIRFVTGMVGAVLHSALLGCFAGEKTLAEAIPSESAVVPSGCCPDPLSSIGSSLEGCLSSSLVLMSARLHPLIDAPL